MLFCFRVLVTSFSLLRLSVRWIRHAIAADDSLFSFGWRICVGAARIFGTSPTAAHDRSCTRHRKILHSMEGMQTINLFFFVWSCASLVFLIIDCFMYEPRAFVFWVFFLWISFTLIDFKRAEEKILEPFGDPAAFDVADVPWMAQRDTFPSWH